MGWLDREPGYYVSEEGVWDPQGNKLNPFSIEIGIGENTMTKKKNEDQAIQPAADEETQTELTDRELEELYIRESPAWGADEDELPVQTTETTSDEGEDELSPETKEPAPLSYFVEPGEFFTAEGIEQFKEEVHPQAQIEVEDFETYVTAIDPDAIVRVEWYDPGIYKRGLTEEFIYVASVWVTESSDDALDALIEANVPSYFHVVMDWDTGVVHSL